MIDAPPLPIFLNLRPYEWQVADPCREWRWSFIENLTDFCYDCCHFISKTEADYYNGDDKSAYKQNGHKCCCKGFPPFEDSFPPFVNGPGREGEDNRP